MSVPSHRTVTAAPPQGGAACSPSSGLSAAAAAAAADRAASSQVINSNVNSGIGNSTRRHTSADGASATTLSWVPSAAVQRLYRDPYAEALSRRRRQDRIAGDSSDSMSAAAAGGNIGEASGAPSAQSPPLPRQQQQLQQGYEPQQGQILEQHGDSVDKEPSTMSERHAYYKDCSISAASMREVSPNTPRSLMEEMRSEEEVRGNTTTDKLSSSLNSSAQQESSVVCVVVPGIWEDATLSVSAAANGGRLDLRARGLTALPCLHLSSDVAAAVPNRDTDRETPEANVSSNGVLTSAHGSGDDCAIRLHALNLRQNHIRTLLTPSAHVNTSGYTAVKKPPLSNCPRSTPLHLYAHISSLDLTHNELTSIAGIEALRCLRSLRLAFNKLTSLSPLWASPYAAELDVLDVNSNSLTELMTVDDVHALEAHCVRIVTHPTQAHATTNSHRSTKTTTTYKSMRLRVLYASNNALRSIPRAIYTFSHLADLRLRKNEIECVPESFPSRACLPALTRLDLSMNHLPAAVVDAITARVATDAEMSHTRRVTPSVLNAAAGAAAAGGEGKRFDGCTSSALNNSYPSSGSSARRVRLVDGGPSASSSSHTPSSAAAVVTGKPDGVIVIQLGVSDNAGCGACSGRNLNSAPSGKAKPRNSLAFVSLNDSAALKNADAEESEGAKITVESANQPKDASASAVAPRDGISPAPRHSSLSSLRKQQHHPSRLSGETGMGKRPSTTSAAATPNTARELHRTSTKTRGKAIRENTNTNINSNSSSDDSACEKGGKIVFATAISSTKRARKSASLTGNAAPSSIGGSDAFTSKSAAAVVGAFESAVQTLGENVYSVNVQRWVTVLWHNLASATQTFTSSSTKAEMESTPSPVQFTVQELLIALAESIGSCVSAPTSFATTGSVAGAGTLKSARPRPANTARVITALLQCLPPANILVFSEDTQARSPPLLVLTGISAAVTTDQQHLLLYEVLAYHLVQSCLSTSKTVAAATATTMVSSPYSNNVRGPTSPQTSYGSPARLVSPLPEYHRMNSSTPLYSTSPPPPQTRFASPPPTSATNASWRSTNTNDRAVRSSGDGSLPSPASRQLAFQVPLQIVHILDNGCSNEQHGAPHQSSQLLWGYMAWRQCWERAVAQRRLKHHDAFVFEVGHSSGSGPSLAPPITQESVAFESEPGEAAGDTTLAGTGSSLNYKGSNNDVRSMRCGAGLYPFSNNPAPVRLFVWRRLCEVRPAAYIPLPAQWDVLYAQLQRANTSSLFNIPPILSGSCERMNVVRGSPVSLNYLLACAGGALTTSDSSYHVAARTSAAGGWPPNAPFVSSPGPPFRRLASAAKTPSANTSSANCGHKQPAFLHSEKGVLAHAWHWHHCRRQLAQRIELETATVAEEQVQACVMPLYSPAEVKQSQRDALASFATSAVKLPERRGEQGNNVVPTRLAEAHGDSVTEVIHCEGEAAKIQEHSVGRSVESCVESSQPITPTEVNGESDEAVCATGGVCFSVREVL